MSDKFLDHRQVLDLRDSVTVEGTEFVISTMMLEEAKILHGRKYWFESYLAEVKDGKIISIKILDQHLTALDAVQGHKFSATNIPHLIAMTKHVVEQAIAQNAPVVEVVEESAQLPETSVETEPVLPIPGKKEDVKSASIPRRKIVAKDKQTHQAK